MPWLVPGHCCSIAGFKTGTIRVKMVFAKLRTWALALQKDTTNTMPVMLKNRHQIDKLRNAGRLVGQALQVVNEHIKPGVTTLELDQIAEEYIRRHGATPSYKGYRGSSSGYPPFPGTICASVNDVICHGIPSDLRLREGDIISIDIGAKLDGWQGDTCATFAVGKLDTQSKELMDTTRDALMNAIEAAGPGRRLGDIGAAILHIVEPHGFSVVREYTGHGIGRRLHEEPTVLHYGKTGTGLMLRAGMVFTIEPMVNIGGAETELQSDGWTVLTADRSRSAQFEHTIAITEHGVEILSVP
jgi:methionyl aminopeptidase